MFHELFPEPLDFIFELQHLPFCMRRYYSPLTPLIPLSIICDDFWWRGDTKYIQIVLMRTSLFFRHCMICFSESEKIFINILHSFFHIGSTFIFATLILPFILFEWLNLSTFATMFPTSWYHQWWGNMLHNVKASLMLCLEAFWNLRNFKLLVKDNVGSGCYGYVIITSQSV